MKLRDYQERGIADLRAAYTSGRKAPVYVCATGSGKTVLSAWIIRGAIERGNRVLFLAGRTELLDQTVTTLGRAGVEDVRLIQAQRDVGNPGAPVVVASIQTVTTPRWEAKRPPADLVILDECHHGSAPTHASVLQAYPAARRLGLTATPERADGKPLGDLFDALVVGPTVRELTDLGHLVPCIVFPPRGGAKLDTKQIALDPVTAYRNHGDGKRAVVFCVSRQHAASVRDEFRAAGYSCDTVDATLSAGVRKETLRRFSCGGIRVLTSVGVLTEGWDDPGCTVAILARGFGHSGLYIQCCGRVLRPAPNKDKAILIDLVGSVYEHGTPDAERTYSLDGKAIQTATREAIKQCKTCGAVFRPGQRCPNCGAESSVMPFSAPDNTGEGLTQLTTPIAPRVKREHVVTITARKSGWCNRCRGPITPGDEILWATLARRAQHKVCGPARVSL